MMGQSHDNMATTHPQLLKFFTSKNPLLVGLKLTPILSTLIYLIYVHLGVIWQGVLLLVIGVIFWSLFEYCVHRWVYHVNYKNKGTRWFVEAFHLHHHRILTDFRVLNAGWLLIYPVTILVWGIVWLLTQDLFLTSCFSFGAMLYYLFYEVIHFSIHYKLYQKGYLAMIQKYHLYHHHRRWNVNYGNTMVYWDMIFKTYDPAYKSFEVNEEVYQNFITEVDSA